MINFIPNDHVLLLDNKTRRAVTPSTNKDLCQLCALCLDF